MQQRWIASRKEQAAAACKEWCRSREAVTVARREQGTCFFHVVSCCFLFFFTLFLFFLFFLFFLLLLLLLLLLLPLLLLLVVVVVTGPWRGFERLQQDTFEPFVISHRRRLEDRGAALTTLRTAMKQYHQKALALTPSTPFLASMTMSFS